MVLCVNYTTVDDQRNERRTGMEGWRCGMQVTDIVNSFINFNTLRKHSFTSPYSSFFPSPFFNRSSSALLFATFPSNLCLNS